MFIRYFVVFLLFGASLQSQSTVAVHDSSLLRGTHEIPLYATLSISSGDSVCVNVHFNPQLLDITGISSSQLSVTQAQYTVEKASLSSALLHLSFLSGGISITNAVLLSLHVELLAGPDSLTVLEPNFLCRNGQAVSGVTFKTGTLHLLDDIPVKPADIEFLGTAFPHPGNDQRFAYHILQKCSHPRNGERSQLDWRSIQLGFDYLLFLLYCR